MKDAQEAESCARRWGGYTWGTVQLWVSPTLGAAQRMSCPHAQPCSSLGPTVLRGIAPTAQALRREQTLGKRPETQPWGCWFWTAAAFM